MMLVTIMCAVNSRWAKMFMASLKKLMELLDLAEKERWSREDLVKKVLKMAKSLKPPDAKVKQDYHVAQYKSNIVIDHQHSSCSCDLVALMCPFGTYLHVELFCSSHSEN